MYKNNNYLKKLLNQPMENLINEIISSVNYLSPKVNSNYARNKKYSTRDYVIGIIDVLNSSISWNRYSGPINGNTLRKKHSLWCTLGIYEHVFEKMINRFMNKVSFPEELKYQSIDSTFIEDINGCKYSGYSGINKRRKGEASKGIKLTVQVTTNAIPISISIDPANKYDSTLLPKTINNTVIKCNTRKYFKNNKYKQYLLADSGYDSKNNINLLKKKKYVPLIKQNRRNTKNKNLIRTFSKNEEKIYKKRTKVENYNSWIKKFPKVKCLYERNISNYRGLLSLANSIIISRRVHKLKK